MKWSETQTEAFASGKTLLELMLIPLIDGVLDGLFPYNKQKVRGPPSRIGTVHLWANMVGLLGFITAN